MKPNLNLFLAIFLSLAIIFLWQHFFEKPRLQNLVNLHKEYNKKITKIKEKQESNLIEREEAIKQTKRIIIKTDYLIGSINTKGLRFDDLSLIKYKSDIKSNECVNLLSPSNSEVGYFASIGFQGNDIEYPDSSTIWEADKSILTVDNPINFSWINSKGVKFIINVSLDEYYLFTIESKIMNNSNQTISFVPYGFINQYYTDNSHNNVYQGTIVSLNQQLEEFSYNALKDKKKQHTTGKHLDWIGITSKYWLTAFIPDGNYDYSSNFSYNLDSKLEKFQVDFIGKEQVLTAGNIAVIKHKLFAGAKNVFLLDEYSKKYNIPLLDRTVDFGWLYFITKPIFYLLSWLYSVVGNFGTSILLLTVILKLVMFPLSNYSYKSMQKLKSLQPKMERIRELYGDDKTRLNQEMMELYKREKANPFSSCLPLLLQLPVFFSIYKVLSVTIEMRHAAFYGWIKDLSAPDPTNIFNLFGLFSFSTPNFLHIGIWPILMTISMYLQQALNPAPSDPVQAKVMKFMPLMFLFLFANFPAGLLIYWTWSNILSIIQQSYITKMMKK